MFERGICIMYRYKEKMCNIVLKLLLIFDNVMFCFLIELKWLCENKIYFDLCDILSLIKCNDYFGDLLLECIFWRFVEKG